MTVSELIEELTELENAGYGKAKVTLASDEEGNDFRPIYEITAEDKEVTIWPY